MFVLKSLYNPGAFNPGAFTLGEGGSYRRVSVYRKHGCVCVCATEEKEHWGQLYLRCLVVVS